MPLPIPTRPCSRNLPIPACPNRNIMMRRTSNENAACLRRICKPSIQDYIIFFHSPLGLLVFLSSLFLIDLSVLVSVMTPFHWTKVPSVRGSLSLNYIIFFPFFSFIWWLTTQSSSISTLPLTNQTACLWLVFFSWYEKITWVKISFESFWKTFKSTNLISNYLCFILFIMLTFK